MKQTLSIWDHAAGIATNLSQALALVDAIALAKPSTARVAETISHVWRRVIEDAKQCKVSLNREYLSSLHSQLAEPIGGDAPGVFHEGSPPSDWTNFANEVVAGDSGVLKEAEAWLLAQLFWGNHVQSMQFSLAWLCVNGFRLQNALYALYPSSQQHDRLMDALRAAGPDTWDAERLRALFWHYEIDQIPSEQ